MWAHDKYIKLFFMVLNSWFPQALALSNEQVVVALRLPCQQYSFLLSLFLKNKGSSCASEVNIIRLFTLLILQGS